MEKLSHSELIAKTKEVGINVRSGSVWRRKEDLIQDLMSKAVWSEISSNDLRLGEVELCSASSEPSGKTAENPNDVITFADVNKFKGQESPNDCPSKRRLDCDCDDNDNEGDDYENLRIGATCFSGG